MKKKMYYIIRYKKITFFQRYAMVMFDVGIGKQISPNRFHSKFS